MEKEGGEVRELYDLGQEKSEAYYPAKVIEVRQKGELAIALILAGGGALAPIHIGVIGALLEAGIPIDIIFGTSAGSIGGIVASRISCIDDWVFAKYLGERVNWDQLLTNADLMRQGGGWEADKLAGYIDNNMAILEANGIEPRPLFITMTDITEFPHTRFMTYWLPPDGHTVGDLVQASCAVPIAMTPKVIDGRKMCDGGASRGGDEPIGLAKQVVPEALTISVKLTKERRKNTPGVEPDVRIKPCLKERNGLPDLTYFDKNDVYRGYLAAGGYIDQILKLMEERGIERVYLPGFLKERGQLMNYFSDKLG